MNKLRLLLLATMMFGLCLLSGCSAFSKQPNVDNIERACVRNKIERFDWLSDKYELSVVCKTPTNTK